MRPFYALWPHLYELSHTQQHPRLALSLWWMPASPQLLVSAFAAPSAWDALSLGLGWAVPSPHSSSCSHIISPERVSLIILSQSWFHVFITLLSKISLLLNIHVLIFSEVCLSTILFTCLFISMSRGPTKLQDNRGFAFLVCCLSPDPWGSAIHIFQVN